MSRTVRSWYTSSTPEIGLFAVPEKFGFLSNSERGAFRRLVLTVDDADQVPEALQAAAEFYNGSDFEVWVDERARAERLTAALAAAGLQQQQDTVVLALVGPIRAQPGPADLTVEDVVDLDGLRHWATVKLQGFANSEDLPDPGRLGAEVEGWQAEWPVCRYQLARLDRDPVGILGHYTSDDQMVFNLATRVPYRHRGIAQALLAQWSKEADSEQARSLLINCDDGGPAAELYGRLGFTDEVYWHRRYAMGT